MNYIVDSSTVNTDNYKYTKTNCKRVNDLFGGSIVKPSVFILYGTAGTGKTTLLSQVCDHCQQSGIKSVYMTGEQSLSALKILYDRIGIPNLKISDNTDIDDICDVIKEYDMVIIDSYPTITYDKSKYKYKKIQWEDVKILRLVEAARKYSTCVGVILHTTKTNTYKGSSNLSHSVDMQFSLFKENGVIVFTPIKNRFASTDEIQYLRMGEKGYQLQETPSIFKKLFG